MTDSDQPPVPRAPRPPGPPSTPPQDHVGVRRRVAFVLPVFDEATGLRAFHAALAAACATRPDLDVEWCYVNDGSRDGSLAVLHALRAADDRVTVVDLARNRGHQVALTAGLDVVGDSADAVVVMDTDLQDPPAVAMELVEVWERGADVVYAQRRSRRDGPLKRASAWGFYWLLDRVTSTPIPRNTGDFRLMDRRVVAELGRYREHDRFLRGLVADIGLRQEAVLFDRDARHSGTTGYPVRAMLRLAASGLLGFSTAPLRLISRLGLAVSFVSALLAVYAVGVRLLSPADAVPGWAFLAVALFLLGGLQLTMLGVVGSYVGRIFTEVQDRPLYAVAACSRGRRDASVTELHAARGSAG